MNVNVDIESVLRSIREDAVVNSLSAEQLLAIYQSGRVAGQIYGKLPNVPFNLHQCSNSEGAPIR